jgi:glutamate formiminotransferase/formiminotetrahydrofolate cyclodeaminase
MPALVECVPNFSEGRRPEIVDAIIAAALDDNHVILLDKEMDADHNRSVVTLVGEPEAVAEAVLRSVRKAAELIDMRTHRGEHPRMGATDVIPFVPISGIDLAECAALARNVGRRLAEELAIPVYLYEAAAMRPDRENLADVRRGEYEGIRDVIETDPNRRPDFGPATMNLKAGATAVGARMPLVAFNCYLDTNRLAVAKAIARAIRFGDGGLRYAKALGFDIKDRGCVQVSMNLVNYQKTPIFRVFEMIKSEAARWGARVTSSEIVGLTPAKSLYDVAEHYLQLERFSIDQVLEEKLRAATARQAEKSGWTLFADHVASAEPAPGGGSVSAAAGALAAALCAMVGRLTIGKKKYADVGADMEATLSKAEELRRMLTDLVDKDAQAFDNLMAARRLPKDTETQVAARSEAMRQATMGAAEVPLEVMRTALQVLDLAQTCAEKGNVNSVSDAGVAALMAHTAVAGAGLNVKINLTGFPDERYREQVFAKMRELDASAARLTDEIVRTVNTKIDSQST